MTLGKAERAWSTRMNPPCVACREAPQFTTDKFGRRLCVGCLATLARVSAAPRFRVPTVKPTSPANGGAAPRPKPSGFWAKRRVRRLARERVRGLNRRLTEARSVLVALTKAEQPRGVEREDTIRRWLEWDEADQRQQESEFLDDLALVYPEADDAALRALADRFRVRPPSKRVP